MNIWRIANEVPEGIFADLSDPNDKCQRIQAMGGTWPDAETNLGGLSITPLATLIAGHLTEAIEREASATSTESTGEQNG